MKDVDCEVVEPKKSTDPVRDIYSSYGLEAPPTPWPRPPSPPPTPLRGRALGPRRSAEGASRPPLTPSTPLGGLEAPRRPRPAASDALKSPFLPPDT